MNLPQYLQNFINKYNGKRIDVDNQFGYQCWDLSQIYAQEVWGVDYYLSCRITGGVKDIYNDFERVMDTNDFTRYPNLRDTVPNVGDFVIWGYGQYGHIAIVLEADVNTFTVLEQNAGQGDGDGLNGDEVKITKYQNYMGVLGFITPKENIQPSQPIPTPTMNNQPKLSLPTKEVWDKVERATGAEHKKYISDAVNDLNFFLLVNDYTDRVNEKTKLETELSQVKKELENKTLINSPQSLENLKSDKVFNEGQDYSQNENKGVINQSSEKTIWQSKKFASLVISAGLGLATIFLKPEQATILLSTIAQIEMTYLGGQSLVDLNLVKLAQGLQKK